jgi:UDP-4-amino-4,6-dideoxy-N-acetyl-beta-L-altrosamine N-acetyltransferase
MMEGECVVLRPMEAADADDVVRWRRDPLILEQMFADEPPTREEHLRWLETIQARGNRQEFIIIERATGRSIGTIGLSDIDRKNQRTEYGILIGEADARNKGYAREASELILKHAFENCGLRRVYLHTFADNTAAVRLYESLGFRIEGMLRQHAFKCGAFRDVMVMAILKDEWGQ